MTNNVLAPGSEGADGLNTRPCGQVCSRAAAASGGNWRCQDHSRIQPVQSPDRNVLNLGTCSSLTKVAKFRVHTAPGNTVEHIAAAVEQAWRGDDEDKLKRSFSPKNKVLKLIHQHDGSNDFKLKHNKTNV